MWHELVPFRLDPRAQAQREHIPKQLTAPGSSRQLLANQTLMNNYIKVHIEFQFQNNLKIDL